MNHEYTLEEIEEQIKVWDGWYKQQEPYRTGWKKSYDNWVMMYLKLEEAK